MSKLVFHKMTEKFPRNWDRAPCKNSSAVTPFHSSYHLPFFRVTNCQDNQGPWISRHLFMIHVGILNYVAIVLFITKCNNAFTNFRREEEGARDSLRARTSSFSCSGTRGIFPLSIHDVFTMQITIFHFWGSWSWLACITQTSHLLNCTTTMMVAAARYLHIFTEF